MSCMVVYCQVWSSIVIYYHLMPHMFMYCHILSSNVMYGHALSCNVVYCHILFCIVMQCHVWSCMATPPTPECKWHVVYGHVWSRQPPLSTSTAFLGTSVTHRAITAPTAPKASQQSRHPQHPRLNTVAWNNLFWFFFLTFAIIFCILVIWLFTEWRVHVFRIIEKGK